MAEPFKRQALGLAAFFRTFPELERKIPEESQILPR